MENEIIKDTVNIRSDEEIRKQLDTKKHKAMVPLGIVCTVITVLVYAAIIYLTVNGKWVGSKLLTFLKLTFAIPVNFHEAFDRGGVLVVVILIIFIIVKTINLFLTFSRNTAVDGVVVTENQFPDLNEYVNECCRIMNIHRPTVYVSAKEIEPSKFGFYIENHKIITIPGILTGNSDLTRFVIARELSKIYYRQSGAKNLWMTIMGRLVPILTQAYSRSCEYSYDRAAQIITGDNDSIERIAQLVVARSIMAKMNMEDYDKQIDGEKEEKMPMSWHMANTLSHIPVGQLRIRAIKSRKDGIMF